jgi:hypothetical protein
MPTADILNEIHLHQIKFLAMAAGAAPARGQQ